MKIKLLFLALASVSIINAQTVISQWNFETSITIPSTGNGTNTIIGSMSGAASSTGSVTGCVQQTGTGAWQIGSANPGTVNESSGVQFMFSTLGYDSIVFEYDHRISNSGTRTVRVQYTIDGTNWINLDVTSLTYINACVGRGAIDNGRIDAADPLGTNVSDSWSRRRINFSTIPSVNDNPNFGVRLMAAFYDVTGQFRQANNVTAVATAGTWRFDNVTLTGRVIIIPPPPPANVSFAGTHASVAENSNVFNIQLNITNANVDSSIVYVTTTGLSNATAISDYTFASSRIAFAPNVNGSQNITVQINDDVLAESDEYIVVKLSNMTNAIVTGTNQFILYIRDNDRLTPQPNNDLLLTLVGSFSNGTAGTNSAEIVVFDSTSTKLYIANSIGAKLDIVDFSNPSSLFLTNSINISAYGNINSVAAKNGIVACAIENGTNPQDSGYVVFFDANGIFIKQVKVGIMPDMIAFNHSGNKVYTCNEGEANSAYTNDPDGSISVIDISGGVQNLTQNNVQHITFTSFNGQENTLRSQGIRIYGPLNNSAKDFEPEYITISDNDSLAWVTLQENNAIAKLNLITNQVISILPIGYKDLNTMGNGIDASDVTSGINIANWPIKSMYLPDAVAQFSSGNQIYLLIANEGDARAYSGFNEEISVSGMNLDTIAFPYAVTMKSNFALGKLKATNKLGDTDNDGDFDMIYAYGGRSFSILNASNANMIYDSSSDLEQITSTHPTFSTIFNASNGSSLTAKNRSDDKGPEPEGITTATINGKTYAFVALERVGGVMIYNITNPNLPVYVGYYNNRSTTSNGPDRGAEGIIFIPNTESPDGNSYLILANEVSSTLTVYRVDECIQSTSITASGNTSFCQGGSVNLNYNSTQNGLAYQWIKNNTNVPFGTTPTLLVYTSGNYALKLTNTAAGCIDTSSAIQVTVNAIPQQPTISQNLDTLISTAAAAYQWYFNNVIINGATNQNYIVTANGMYSVMIIDINGCTTMSSQYPFFTVGADASETVLNTISVFPNPFSDLVNISFQIETPSFVNIELYNIIGEKISNAQNGNLGAGKHQFTLNQFGADNIYLLRITINGNTQLKYITRTR
jgi:hypothetical protein